MQLSSLLVSLISCDEIPKWYFNFDDAAVTVMTRLVTRGVPPPGRYPDAILKRGRAG